MYRISYSYYERGKDNMPKGQPIWGSVTGNTIKEVNGAFAEARNNHDCFKYTIINFSEIKEE